MYQNALGVEKNLKEAFKLYQMASDEGNNANAQFNLGLMYLKGDGVEKNINKTIEYWKKASEQGFESATNNLSILCKEVPNSCKKGV